LLAAYVGAAKTAFEGYDTAEVVDEFGDLTIASVPGDPFNVKVTEPADLEKVAEILEGLSRNEPR
jgi:2-C-methyl-D-erythritol 4-phosphate cytidylyltransferase